MGYKLFIFLPMQFYRITDNTVTIKINSQKQLLIFKTILVLSLLSLGYSSSLDSVDNKPPISNIGITAGTPGGFNVNCFHYTPHFVFEISGGGVPYFIGGGLQLNAEYKMFSGENYYHAIGLAIATGYWSIDGNGRNFKMGFYLAPVYNYQYKHFFVEAGPNFSTLGNYFDYFQFQIGYLFFGRTK